MRHPLAPEAILEKDLGADFESAQRRSEETVQHRGVHYDTGVIFRGPGYSIPTRREDLDYAVVRRELQIIRDDLHANAVRIVGSDLTRLLTTTEIALEEGLEVWFSPMFFNYSAQETATKLVEAAKAVSLFATSESGPVTFIAGSELTLFVSDIVPAKSIELRLAKLKSDPSLLRNGRLGTFLNSLVPELRSVFRGPLTYAALMFEQLDWDLFDFVGVDHYRDDRVKDRYIAMIEPLVATGKPVIVTEFGMRTYRGAQSSGALGLGITDPKRLFLHNLPIVGRFIRPRLRAAFDRDEAMQAREIDETLTELEHAGVAGALLSTFCTPQSPIDSKPRYDLDLDSMAIVKALPRHQRGTRYPDMYWEPKMAFETVAEHYAS